jgi:hypothetical protein
MAVTIRDRFIFDGANKEVRLVEGYRKFSAVELYSACIDYLHTDEGIKYYPFAFSIGNNPISDEINVGTYIFVNTHKGWRGRPPQEDNVVIEITGNLYPKEVGVQIIVPYDEFSTTLIMRNSNLTEVVRVSTGSGLSQEEHDKLMGVPTATENADAVFDGIV